MGLRDASVTLRDTDTELTPRSPHEDHDSAVFVHEVLDYIYPALPFPRLSRQRGYVPKMTEHILHAWRFFGSAV